MYNKIKDILSLFAVHLHACHAEHHHHEILIMRITIGTA